MRGAWQACHPASNHPQPHSNRAARAMTPSFAGRGHYRLVQMILETAVAHDGPERAKVKCINHANKRGQSALMLACMNG